MKFYGFYEVIMDFIESHAIFVLAGGSFHKTLAIYTTL